MTITATEAKNNFGKYLTLSSREDIFITKQGKIIAKLSRPEVDKISVINSLVGIIPSSVSEDTAKQERLARSYVCKRHRDTGLKPNEVPVSDDGTHEYLGHNLGIKSRMMNAAANTVMAIYITKLTSAI